MYITRMVESVVKRISDSHRVMLVVGARQVGKTALLKHLMGSERTYVTLDDIAVRYFAMTDPSLFLQRYKPPVFIDAIQYVPQLLDCVKAYADTHDEIGAIWLASSQVLPLAQDAKELLGDNVGIVDLQGLSAAEINDTDNIEAFLPVEDKLNERLQVAEPLSLPGLFGLIWHGSLPAIYDGTGTDWEVYYSSYVQTLITHDIMKLIKVRDEIQFYRFLCATAAQTGKLVNYGELAKASNISQTTAKQWVNVLEAAGIIYLLQPFAPEGAKYVVKAPKLHFTDTGLAAYLLRWNSPEALMMGAMSGAFFESYVVGAVYKSYSNKGMVPPLYYFRNFNSKEVELIIYVDNVLYPLSIKASGFSERAVKLMAIVKPLAEDVEGLRIGEKSVVCLTDGFSVTESGTQLIPAWML